MDNQIHDHRQNSILQIFNKTETYTNNFLSKFRAPVIASKSYRYLSRQIALDLANITEGKLIIFSSATNISTSSEILLMLGHFLQDELASRILIIDATFRKSGLTKLLSLDDQCGFTNILSNNDDGIDSVTHTLKNNISFIAVGDLSKHHLPYASEGHIKSFLDKFKQQYDYTIIQQDDIRMDTRYLPFAKSADLVLLHLEERITPVAIFDEIKQVFLDHKISNVKYIVSEP